MAGAHDDAIVPHALHMSSIESRLLDNGERLIGFGFRCWLSGYRESGADAWQVCWHGFCQELGCAGARRAVTDLSAWVNCIRHKSLRRIELLPNHCPSFSRDECLAVTMVAASEHRHCPALQICAQLLLGAADVAPVMEQAHRFRLTLESCGVDLSHELVSPIPSRRLH